MNTHILVNQVTPINPPELPDCIVLEFSTRAHAVQAVSEYTGFSLETYLVDTCLIFPIKSSTRH